MFEDLTTKPIKRKRVLKERAKTNFQGQYDPYDMYWNEKAVLKADLV